MIKHVTSVDQSDRRVPYNLRQSGPTPVQMLISTQQGKSPYWHLSMRLVAGELLFTIEFIIQEVMLSLKHYEQWLNTKQIKIT